MEVKFYRNLPNEAAEIRRSVFMEEQGFHDEFDGTDDRACHAVAFDGDKPVGTCRYFREEGSENFTIGRIAVLKEYRGKSIGALMLKMVEEEIRRAGGTKCVLHAQTRVEEFYKKQGYKRNGEEDEEEGCPHIWMGKTLV